MESSNGLSQNQDNSSSSGLTSATDAVISAPVHEERSFKQSEVNEIVKRAKYGAVEDFRRLQAEQPEYAQRKYGDSHSNNHQERQSQSALDEEKVRQIARDVGQQSYEERMQEYRNRSEMEAAQKIVDNFRNKISTGKDKYQDFDSRVGKVEDYASYPNLVKMLAEDVDNMPDVLYELSKDKLRMFNLNMMASNMPDHALSEIKRLSQSLKDNEDAKKARIPNEPLSQLRPSNTGTDNGAMSVKDLRLKYRI